MMTLSVFTEIKHLVLTICTTWIPPSVSLKPCINNFITCTTSCNLLFKRNHASICGPHRRHMDQFLFYWNHASIFGPHVRHDDTSCFTETTHKYADHMYDMMTTFFLLKPCMNIRTTYLHYNTSCFLRPYINIRTTCMTWWHILFFWNHA